MQWLVPSPRPSINPRGRVPRLGNARTPNFKSGISRQLLTMLSHGSNASMVMYDVMMTSSPLPIRVSLRTPQSQATAKHDNSMDDGRSGHFIQCAPWARPTLGSRRAVIWWVPMSGERSQPSLLPHSPGDRHIR